MSIRAVSRRSLVLTLVVLLVPFVTAFAQRRSPKTARPARVERADVYVTAKGTSDRIAKKAPLAFETLAQPDEHDPTIILDRDVTFQTVVGIGGALTDASAETYFKLPEAKRQEILTALFDRTKGNGFSLGRTHIHSCDFSSASYTYDDVAGDAALAHFSIEHDMKYRVPFIKAALAAAGPGFTLYASPWSPPAWMKTNGDMLHGGRLEAKYAATWANYYVKFVRAYEKAGIPIWGLTVQNEPMATQPWESCLFTAEEERDFVRDHLGPTLAKSGLGRLKLMIWDHNRGVMYQRAKVVYDDPAASKYVWGTGFHWYVGDHFDNVRLVHDAYPTKALMFTEGTEAQFDPATLEDWKWGEVFGRSLVEDFNHWATGWTVWNVLLDETGGPNHVGNFCMAPIIGDTKTGKLTYMASFWYLGHFSKFVRPGAKRIVASSNADELATTAFVNTDGSVVVEVLNFTDKDVAFATWLEGRQAKTTSPAHSIVTVVIPAA